LATWDELTAIRPGVALRLRGDEFVVERCGRFEDASGGWWEHRLSSNASGSSLWLEVPADPAAPVIAYQRSDFVGEEPDGRAEIEHGGATYPLLTRGLASYRTMERSAASKRGQLEYYEYAGGGRRVSFERRDRGAWEVSEGEEIDPAAIELLA
jgi:hypothetical protein